MVEKEMEIDWNGAKEKVVFKRLTFGERNRFLEEFVKVRLVGELEQIEVLHGQMKTITLHRCIVKAPFKTDVVSIENLDVELGDLIYDEIAKFNKLSMTKKAT